MSKTYESNTNQKSNGGKSWLVILATMIIAATTICYIVNMSLKADKNVDLKLNLKQTELELKTVDGNCD